MLLRACLHYDASLYRRCQVSFGTIVNEGLVAGRFGAAAGGVATELERARDGEVRFELAVGVQAGRPRGRRAPAFARHARGSHEHAAERIDISSDWAWKSPGRAQVAQRATGCVCFPRMQVNVCRSRRNGLKVGMPTADSSSAMNRSAAKILVQFHIKKCYCAVSNLRTVFRLVACSILPPT